MELEEKQLFRDGRWNLIGNRKKKEWWYVGVSDESQGIYFGFDFLRVNLVDSFHFVLFNPKTGKLDECAWKGYLDAEILPGQAFLRHVGKGVHLEYRGDERNGWTYTMRYQGISIDLNIEATTPPFTKYDNMFVDEYALLHFFHNRVSGNVQTPHGNYVLNNALGYYDHCFGAIPRKSRWHWIAVQNEHFALASLMNYGPTPQCYTQGYFVSQAPESACRRWIRFDQDVSFECDPLHTTCAPWRVTSPDMDLTLDILQRSKVKTRIPPLVPFLIKIDHGEHFVRLHGRVRVDGMWIETGDLFGVLEEHHGVW